MYMFRWIPQWHSRPLFGPHLINIFKIYVNYTTTCNHLQNYWPSPPPHPHPPKKKTMHMHGSRGGGSEFGRGVPIHFLKNSDFLITTCHSHGKVVENTGKPWTPLANKITSPSGKKILAPRMIPRDRYPVDTAVMLPVFWDKAVDLI